MSIDKTGAKSTPSVQQLSERWTETIKAEHESNRGGVDSFESGFDAFRNLLAIYSSFRKHDLLEKMISGEATAEEVASDYRTNVLGPGLDRIVPLEKSAYKVVLPDGDIAVVPHTMRSDPAVAGAILTYLCRSHALDDGIPRMLTPIPYLINNTALGPINIAERTLIGGISIWEDGNVLHIEDKGGETLADFAFSYPFERDVRSIDDPGLFLETWNRYLNDLLFNLRVNFAAFENSLPSDTKLYGYVSEEDEDRILVRPHSDIWPNLMRTQRIIETAGMAFSQNPSFGETWLYRFIRTQVAEFNNNSTSIRGGMSMIKDQDLSLYSFRLIAKGFGAFEDPVKHIDKSFVAMHSQKINRGTVEYWLKASFEDGSVTEGGEIIPSNGIALRMILDEIVYQAGAARDESAHEITFHFKGERAVIKDKGLRGALDYYSRNEEARSRLEEYAKKLGESGRIEFHRGALAGGEESVTAIEIAFDRKGVVRANGSGEGVRGSSTTSSASGFRGIARSRECEATQHEIVTDDETFLAGATSGLATGASTVIHGAAASVAARTAFSAI